MLTEFVAIEAVEMRFLRLLMHMMIDGALCLRLGLSTTDGEPQVSHEEARLSFQDPKKRTLSVESFTEPQDLLIRSQLAFGQGSSREIRRDKLGCWTATALPGGGEPP